MGGINIKKEYEDFPMDGDNDDVEIILEKATEKKPVGGKLPDSGVGAKTNKSGNTAPKPPVTPFNEIPRIFCANKEVAKKLFGDFLVIVGALKAIETGELKPGDMMNKVVKSTETMIENLSDILVRDSRLSESDLLTIAKALQLDAANAVREYRKENQTDVKDNE